MTRASPGSMTSRRVWNALVSKRRAQKDDVEKVDPGRDEHARHDVAQGAAPEAAPSDSGKGDPPVLAKAATA